MRIELMEVHWLDQSNELSLTQLAELSGLSEAELRELVEAGAILPIDASATSWSFCADCIATARTALRLRNDFELDAQGLALALGLLDRIHDLETQLRELSARLPRRTG
ncbi:MAG TPA: chaperone modulator CbpM [Burkholderiaceae bacterium]|nr:chaperone modulator CbpM [Burkholderiaceae bacterium]